MNDESRIPRKSRTFRERRWLFGCGLFLLLLICGGSTFLALRGFDLQALTIFSVGDPGPASQPTSPRPTESAQTEDEDRQQVPEGRIAFISSEGQIGTAAPDGSQLRQLTDDEGRIYLFPAWAPQGDRIAAISSSTSGAGVHTVSDAAGAEATELYFDEDDAPIYLYWSRNGENVSFIASYESALGLFLAPADGAGENLLLATGQPLYWDWVAQEERLLVHTGTPQSGARVTFVDVAEAQSSGDEVSTPGYFQAPVVSADGAYIGFAEVDANESRWVVIRERATGGTSRTEHAGVAAMGWSPTENRLAIISADSPRRSPALNYYGPLRLLDADTGDAQMLVDERVLAFFWSPDGQKIAYLTVAAGQGEQVAERTGGGPWQRRGKLAAQHEELRLSLSLVDVFDGQRAHLLDFRPTEIFVRQFLPFFDQYALSHNIWSPDSSALVIPVIEGEQGKIYAVNANGQGIQAVAEGLVAFWSNR